MADILRKILRGQQQPDHAGFGFADHLKAMLFPERHPSITQLLPVVLALLPITGILLALVGTVIGLAVVTPLFVIFSPVLIPAAIAIGLAVMGFLASGAFGIARLSSLSWILKYVREAREQVPEEMEQVKRRMGEVAGQVEQKTKDVGQGIQNKAHEHMGTARSTT